MLVAIDPGLQTGWAIWGIDGLVDCGLGDPRTSRSHVVTSRAGVDVIDDVWIEYQVIYPRSKARPADILKLTLEAGRWVGVYSTLGVEPHLVKPAEWKGQVPKDIHHARVWAELSEDSRLIVDHAVRGVAASKRHNVLDAVGLALWASKR